MSRNVVKPARARQIASRPFSLMLASREVLTENIAALETARFPRDGDDRHLAALRKALADLDRGEAS